MADSTITAKGHTTVPAEIRASLGVTAGSRLVWYRMPDGGVIVRAKAGLVLDLAGSLRAPKGKRVNIADMEPHPAANDVKVDITINEVVCLPLQHRPILRPTTGRP